MSPTAIRTAASALLGGPKGLGFGLQEDEIQIFEDSKSKSSPHDVASSSSGDNQSATMVLGDPANACNIANPLHC
jgi:hypothetical protein